MPALMPRNPHRNAPEYADRVNLIKKIKIGKDWRFAPVVPEANGRLKDKVRINGQVEVHIEGSYFIEWWVTLPTRWLCLRKASISRSCPFHRSG